MKFHKDVTMKILLSFLMVVLGFGGSAFAALSDVGPVSLDNGFPLWYSDSNGVVLQACLDPEDLLCGFNPGDIPDPSVALSIPDNFPQEFFYFLAGSKFKFTPPGGGNQVFAKMVLALEGAFNTLPDGTPALDEQVVFARVKFFIPNLLPETVYTITYPYGIEHLTTDTKGVIKYTEDIGLTTGAFSEALGGKVDPFLESTSGVVGYLGDPAFDHTITGAPHFDTATGSFANFFRIEGGGLPSGGIESNLFSIMGKRLGGPLNNVVVTDWNLLPRDRNGNFGPTLVDDPMPPVPRTVTITNVSQGDFAIDSIDLTNLPAPFSIIADTCTGRTVTPPGGSTPSCTLEITFTPAALGSVAGSFDIHLFDFPATPAPVCTTVLGVETCIQPPTTPNTDVVTFNVSGKGAAPDISVTDPDPLNSTSVDPVTGNILMMPFDTTTIGTSSDRVVQVTNNGDLYLNITSVTLSNPGGDFSILEGPGIDTCSGTFGTVTPAASCNFTIRFTPLTVDGTPVGTVTIISDSLTPEGSVSFGVSGGASDAPAPIISADTSSLSYGDVNIGDSRDLPVTISNSGNAALNISNVSGLLIPYGLSSDDCSGASLQPGVGECTVVVRFSPDSTETNTGLLDIESDGGRVKVTLRGTGVPVPVPDISIQDAADRNIAFGNVTAGLTVTHTVDVLNIGDASLEIGLIGNPIANTNPLAAPFSFGRDTCSLQTLAPGESCFVEVQFAPDVAGNVNDAFGVPSNDPDESLLTVTASGTGLSAVINNAPSPVLKVAPADAQKAVGTSPLVSWQASSDPDGDTVSYTVRYCENLAMKTNCVDVDKAVVASAITKASKSLSFAELGIGTGMVFGIILIGGADRRRRFGMFVAAMIVSGALLSSCSGGGSHDIKSAGGSAFASDLSVTLPGLKPSTTYYWKVIAKDGTGNETTSTIWRFTT